MEHVKMKEMRKYNKMNHLNLLLHLHKRTTMPTTIKKDKKKKKTIKRVYHPDPNKSSHELEQESQRIIPLNQSSTTSTPGESLALKLVWPIFVNTTHSSLELNV